MIDGHARSLLLGDLQSEVDAIVVGAGAAGCALAGGASSAVSRSCF
jgi:choline dehydrogenase-like flavoprotein